MDTERINMNKLYILVLLILLSCNSNSTKRKDKTKDSTDLVSIKNVIQNTSAFGTPGRDILYVSMNKDAIVFGDSSNKKINYVAIKFETYIRFSDFHCDSLHRGQLDSINFESNPVGKMFKTRIRETVRKEEVNFGGHYCFVYWGCGSPCQASVVVDLVTGMIYDGPSASLEYEFQKNSRMLVVNPTKHDGTDDFHPKPDFYLDCPYCKPQIYIWIEDRKIFEKR
jgi:hypothetical protein